MSFFVGCVVGLVAGLLLAWVFSILASAIRQEAAADPLTYMGIAQDHLTTEETKRHIDQLAGDYLESDKNVGLVIGVIEDGESHVYAYGKIATDSDVTPDESTVFEIASVGKTFTATVLAEMSLRGELDLDDSIENFLPDDVRTPQSKGRSITLHDLATHCSGLPCMPPNFREGDPLNPYADYTIEEMYEALGQIELTEPIGWVYEYSNFGFGLLGHLLELKLASSYEQIVIDRLCAPLELNATRMTLDESLKRRLAVPHANGKPVVVWEDTTMAGAGSFLSTAGDMIRFLSAHFNAGDSPLKKAMSLTIQKRRPTNAPATAMGLGWHVDSENALDIVWHNGGSGGSRSYAAMLPSSKTAVVVLSNSTSSVDDLGKKLLYLLHWH